MKEIILRKIENASKKRDMLNCMIGLLKHDGKCNERIIFYEKYSNLDTRGIILSILEELVKEEEDILKDLLYGKNKRR